MEILDIIKYLVNENMSFEMEYETKDKFKIVIHIPGVTTIITNGKVSVISLYLREMRDYSINNSGDAISIIKEIFK